MVQAVREKDTAPQDSGEDVTLQEQKKNNMKKCFIITPIGSESDPIRRHIDGIIEAAIRPALGDKYDLIVAHKINEPGTITKQVISEIYNADLVVANLTNRNPNVMYELAFRHCLGKPAIMIAEYGTNLPADIVMERAVFYKNDAQGVLDLRELLKKAEAAIDFEKVTSPIHDILQTIYRDKRILQMQASQGDGEEQQALPYILEKLNRLENLVLTGRGSAPVSLESAVGSGGLLTTITSDAIRADPGLSELIHSFFSAMREIPFININHVRYNVSEGTVGAYYQVLRNSTIEETESAILQAFERTFETKAEKISTAIYTREP